LVKYYQKENKGTSSVVVKVAVEPSRATEDPTLVSALQTLTHALFAALIPSLPA
jgi:hypothetical protein